MKTSGDTRPTREEFPSFELAFRFDDADEPREVTVFLDEEESRLTAWISMDVQHVVALEDVA